MEEKDSKRERLKDFLWSIRDDRKKQVIAGIILLVFLGGVSGIVALVAGGSNDQPETETVEIAPEEEVAVDFNGRRFLDGMPSEDSKANAFPIMIMIENLVTIRDLQSGLQNAGVVYEVLAEGGITRFAAVYTNYLEEDEQVEEFTPVRSARHYFVDLAKEYGAVYAHAGGSPYALEELAATSDVEDLDQIGGSEGYYYREDDVAAPHNLSTSNELLMNALEDRELDDVSGTYSPWEFRSETDEEDREVTEQVIDIPYTALSYATRYEYDAEENLYKRFNGGVEHVDVNTGEQITVKNVVVQFAQTSLLEPDTGRLDITLVGEGRALIFQEGEAIEGTWSKDEETSRTRFYDENQEEVEFVPGNIWVSIVPTDNEVTY
jgi:hypothetical protein